MEKLFLGIDIGSTTFKAVLMTESGKVRHTMYQRTKPVDTVHVSMVSDGQSRHPELLGSFKKSADRGLAVKNGILCMYVKMNEGHDCKV